MLINIKENGKWGYYNSETGKIIPCRFRDSSDFIDGFAIVRIDYNSSYGVIDENGEEIVPCKYYNIKRLRKGIFELYNSCYVKEKCLCDSKGMLLDDEGNVLCEDFQRYDIVYKLDNNLYFVSQSKHNGILYNNQLIIEYDDNRQVEDIKCGLILFSNGNGSRWLYNLKGDLLLENYGYFHITPNSFVTFSGHKVGHGIADHNGNVILEPKYWNVNYLHDDIFKLIYQKGFKEKSYEVLYDSSKNCFIVESDTGLLEMPTIFDWCGNNYGNYTIIANNYKFGIINQDCSIIADCIYSEIKECVGDIAIVRKDSKWQLLNLITGNISSEYDNISHLKDDYFIFYLKYSYGIIDRNDNLIVPNRFNDDIEVREDGTFKVSKGYSNRLCRIIDREGRIILKNTQKDIILPKEIVWVHDFSEGYAIVDNIDGLKGTIDLSGNMVIPFKYRGELSDFKNGESTISINFGSWGSNNYKTSKIDINGRFICQHNSKDIHVDCECCLVSDFIGDRSIAYDGKFWGLIDTNGTKISEFAYNTITYLDKGFYKVERNGRWGIIDYKAKVFLPCKYVNVRLSENGQFEAIIKEERWHDKILESMIINHDGYIVVECGDYQVNVPQEYDSISAFEGEYAKVVSNNKWGLIDKQGACVLPCKYDFLDDVVNNHIHVRVGNKDYIISLDDNDVFEIGSVKTAIYYDDSCIVISDYLGALKVYGIVNRQGDVIRKRDYDEIGPFKGEYAYLSTNKYPYNNRKYGLINKKGEIVIEPQYFSLEFNESNSLLVSESCKDRNGKAIYKNVNYCNETVLINGTSLVNLPERYSRGRDFNEGLAAVAIIKEEEDPFSPYRKRNMYLWGFINISTDEIIECIYDEVSDFMYGYSVASLSRKKGIINKLGESVVPFEYNEIVILSKDYIKVSKNGYTGLINFNNELVVPIIYSDVLEPTEGLFPVKQDSLWGFINSQNELIIDTKYTSVRHFHEGMAAVSEKKRWTFVNAKGEEIIRLPNNLDVSDFHDDVALVSFKDKDEVVITHKLLRNGNYLVDGIELNLNSNRIEKIWHFHDGLAKVIVDGFWGFVNTKGEIIISGINDEIGDFKDGYAKFVDNEEKDIYLDKHGNLAVFEKTGIITFSNNYSEVKRFYPGLYKVRRKEDGFIGIVDRYGKIIIPFTEDDIRLISSHNDAPPYIQIREEWDEDEERFIFYNTSGDRIIPNNGAPVVIMQDYGKTAEVISSGLAAVSKDELWGFINERGDEVISCQFYNVEDFVDDYCVVYDSEYNKSVIDKSGKLIFPYRQYGTISFINDGFEVTHKSFGHTERYESYDDNWESEWIPEERNLNNDGELQVPLYGEVISLPKDFDWCATEFKEGFLTVHSKGKWGVVDTKLNVIIPCIYDEPILFNNGLSIAKKEDESYVLNETGKIIFQGYYKSVKRFKDERMFVCLTADRTHFDIYRDSGILLFYSNNVKSRIEIPGTESLSTNYFSPCRIVPMDTNYLKFCISVKYNSGKIEKWGFCDAQGHVVLEARYDDINGFGSGLIAVCRNVIKDRCNNKLWGYVDVKGNLIIDYQYSEAQPFSKGIAIVAKKEIKGSSFPSTKYGIIGSNGKELTDFVYDSAKKIENGIEVSDYRHKNQISLDGDILYRYYDDNSGWSDGHVRGYDWCSEGHKGFHVVSKGNSQGIIDDSGTETFALTDLEQIQIDFDEEENLVFKQYYLGTKSINEKGQIKSTNNKKEILLPVGIQWCTEWQDNYIPVRAHGKWGLLNSDMKWIVEPYYDKLQYVLNNKVLCIKNSEDGKDVYIYDIVKDEFKQLNYDDCSDFENGVAIVSRRNNESKRDSYFYGLIDNNGCELLPCTYQNMQFKEPKKDEDQSYYNSYDSYEDYNDYERDTWDAMTDGMYGDMPDGFDGDYSFLGY